MKRVFFSADYTKERDWFDSLRASPLAEKFCIKTKKTTFIRQSFAILLRIRRKTVSLS
jgi:hypothetical protein